MVAGVVSVNPTAADKPVNGSRILTTWRAEQERTRRERAAQSELAAARSTFLRHQSGRPSAKALDAMVAQLPGPAFPVISGQRSHGATAEQEQRAFAAGGTDRLSAGWLAFNTGINADLEAALPTLRARSRDWWMNTDDGERFGTLLCDNVIGEDAPRLQMRAKLPGSKELDTALNDAVEAAYAVWCEEHCDIAGELTFGEICRTNLASAGRDGEFLNRQVRGKQLPHGFALQLLDVDRIDSSRNVAPVAPGQNGIRLGIEIDPNGRKQAAWLTNGHPGDPGAGVGSSIISERVPVDNLFHGFLLKRPEQLRGYPWAANVLRTANGVATFAQYAIVAAKVGAGRMGFYTTSADVLENRPTWDEIRDATGQLVQDVEAGMLEALPPGVDFKESDPAYPHQFYGPFMTDHRRAIAAGLNVAHHNLSGDMTGVNYSSARIAELAERRHWRAIQRWFCRVFVRPAFREWLRCALLKGVIVVAGKPIDFSWYDRIVAAAGFQFPGWAWVDPEADISAAAMALTYDMRSLRQICAENGVDLDEVLADKKQLRQLYEQMQLTVPAWMEGGAPKTALGASPKPSPAPKPAPQPAGEPA